MSPEVGLQSTSNQGIGKSLTGSMVQYGQSQDTLVPDSGKGVSVGSGLEGEGRGGGGLEGEGRGSGKDRTPVKGIPKPGFRVPTKSAVSPKIEGIGKQLDPKKGKIVQRTYTLNEVNALKKKLKFETTRKPEVSAIKEASDASNVSVEMKSSMFELTKSRFIADLSKDKRIVSIENGVGARAKSNTCGDALVEVAMNIKFRVDANCYTVKFTAYTTTSSFVIQPIGDKIEDFAPLGNVNTPMYFTNRFLVPWTQEMIRTETYTKTMSDDLISKLKVEIKRLDTGKLDTKKNEKIYVGSGDDVDAKCVSKSCKFAGINPNNKTAVATCENCGHFEHFACAKMSSEMKDEVVRGESKYFCSICFSRNPSISLQTEDMQKVVLQRTRLSSMPIFGQGQSNQSKVEEQSIAREIDLEKEESVGESTKHSNDETETSKNEEQPKAGEIELEKNDSVGEKNKIEETVTLDESAEIENTRDEETETVTSEKLETPNGHDKEECEFCEFKTSVPIALENHVQKEHRHICDICQEEFSSDANRTIHMSIHKSLPIPCTWCQQTFISQSELAKHEENCHIQCKECAITFPDQGGKDTHMKERHDAQRSIDDKITQTDEFAPYCPICDESFSNKDTLKKHIDKYHLFSCNKCNTTFKNRLEYESHCKEMHTICCFDCKETFGDVVEFASHQDLHHLTCHLCKKVCNNKPELEHHIDEEHMTLALTCTQCEYNCILESAMVEHILRNHMMPNENREFLCSDCSAITKDKEMIGKHFIHAHGSKSMERVKDDKEKLVQEKRKLA